MAQEGAANLLITASWEMLSAMKSELGCDHTSSHVHAFTDLPSQNEVTSLYHLTTKLFKIVPLKLFKNIENQNNISHYIAETSSNRVIHLSKLVSAHINTICNSKVQHTKMIKSKKIICASSAVISRQNEFYADGIVFPGSQEFLCKLCDNIDNSIVFLRASNSKLPLPTSLPLEEITYEEETIQCIQEVVNDYQRLYPECDFCLLFPNSPIFKEVAKISQRTSSGTQFFLKVDNENSNLHSNEIFGSYVFAACLAFDKRLIDEKSVLAIIRKAIEELQGLLCRKMAYNPSVRWNDLRVDIHSAYLRMTTQIVNESLRDWILCELQELKKICKQNQAALWLSEQGADMILSFREWVLSQEVGAGKRTSPEGGNILIDLCRCDLQKFSDLRKILIPDVTATNQSNRRNLPVPPGSRSRSCSIKKSAPPLRQASGTINTPPVRLSRTEQSPRKPKPPVPPRSSEVRGGGRAAFTRSQPVPRGLRRPTNSH